MAEAEGLQNSTVRRRLSALSSLFTHLIERDPAIHQNPARDVDRPNINRKEGTTPAFSPEQARTILDAPDPEPLGGLRDRAILSVGFQCGLRRSEIAHLTVRDFHVNAGFDSPRVHRKGGKGFSRRLESFLADGLSDGTIDPLRRPPEYQCCTISELVAPPPGLCIRQLHMDSGSFSARRAGRTLRRFFLPAWRISRRCPSPYAVAGRAHAALRRPKLA